MFFMSKYQGRVDPCRLVFIDETWTKTNMAPLRGWAPRGLRLVAKVPHGHWKTTTFLAALRHDRIDAPWLFNGPIDGESFQTYVEKVLVPTLRPQGLLKWIEDVVRLPAGIAAVPTRSPTLRSRDCSPVTRGYFFSLDEGKISESLSFLTTA